MVSSFFNQKGTGQSVSGSTRAAATSPETDTRPRGPYPADSGTRFLSRPWSHDVAGLNHSTVDRLHVVLLAISQCVAPGSRNPYRAGATFLGPSPMFPPIL